MANPFTGGAASFSGIDYLAPEVAQQQREILRQQAIADLLRQKSLEDDNQTQVVSGYAIPNSGVKRFSQLGQALMAGYMQRKIDDKQAAVAQQLANKFNGMSYAPASQSGSATDMLTQPGSATTAPIYDGAVSAPSYDSRKTVAPGATGGASGPSLQTAMMLSALGLPVPPKVMEQLAGVQRDKEIVRVDAGNFVNIYAVDPMTGAQQLVSQVPKGASPDAQLSAGVSVRGQDLGANTARRGQDMTAATASNAQAIDARTAGTPGTFAGTGIDAQANNVYIALTLKQNAGQALTPKEQIDYEMAIRQLTQPRLAGTPETGFFMVNPPPLPAGTPPVSATAAPVGAPPPPTNAPAGAPPELQPNFPDVRTPGSAPTVTQISAPNKTPNENQSKAAGFSARMQNAESIFTATPNGLSTYTTQIAGAVPKVGDSLRRASQTEDQQKYDQAKEDWIRAVLRKESGASISDQEREGQEKTYFPQPGEGPELVKQKAIARKLVMEALQKEAGTAAYESKVTGSDKTIVKWEELK